MMAVFTDLRNAIADVLNSTWPTTLTKPGDNKQKIEVNQYMLWILKKEFEIYFQEPKE